MGEEKQKLNKSKKEKVIEIIIIIICIVFLFLLSMEVVAQLVGQIWDCSFNETCLQFGYLYHYKDSVERLRNQAQKLAYTRERVQAKIDEATRRGEIILDDVMNWIGRVDGITAEAEKFLRGEDKTNKRAVL